MDFLLQAQWLSTIWANALLVKVSYQASSNNENPVSIKSTMVESKAKTLLLSTKLLFHSLRNYLLLFMSKNMQFGIKKARDMILKVVWKPKDFSAPMDANTFLMSIALLLWM